MRSLHEFGNITRPNCALDRRTILCLHVPGFHRKVFKHVKILSERSKESKKKKNKGSVLVAESPYTSQNAQLGLVMNKEFFYRIITWESAIRVVPSLF